MKVTIFIFAAVLCITMFGGQVMGERRRPSIGCQERPCKLFASFKKSKIKMIIKNKFPFKGPFSLIDSQKYCYKQCYKRTYSSIFVQIFVTIIIFYFCLHTIRVLISLSSLFGDHLMSFSLKSLLVEPPFLSSQYSPL